MGLLEELLIDLVTSCYELDPRYLWKGSGIVNRLYMYISLHELLLSWLSGVCKRAGIWSCMILEGFLSKVMVLTY